MRTVLRLSPAVLLLACLGSVTSGPVDPPPPTDDAPQKPKLDSYLFRDSLREIRFLVSTHMHMSLGVQCEVEQIVVNLKGDKQPLQRLPVEGMLCPCPLDDGQFPGVELADYNFDGIRDIRVTKAAQDLARPAHRYWLWDVDGRVFRSSRELDSIQDPLFDHARKMVSSQWYAGASHRGGSTFRYEQGTLVMVSNMEKFSEGDHERWVTWGMKDGTFQPLQEKQVPLNKR